MNNNSLNRRVWDRFANIAVMAILVFLCSCQCSSLNRRREPQALSDREIVVLNELRNEINLVYGFQNGWPRINRGPCGRFAKMFYEEWNRRFDRKVIIAFVMMPEMRDGVGCDHVLIKFPDGTYFDGGSGIITGETLLKEFPPGDRIEEMANFDLELLNKRSYGLFRSYELCPNYSDETTAKIIEKYLTLLTGK